MKKSIAIIAILLLIAGAAYARMTVIGVAGMVAAPAGGDGIAYEQSASSQSASVAFSGNVTNGNLLVAVVAGDVCSNISTPTDTQEGTWTAATACQDHNDSFLALGIYYRVATSTGACTVTATGAGSIAVAEYSGTATSSVLDVSGRGANNQDGTSFTSGDITTTTADTVLIGAGVFYHDSTATWTAGANYTERVSQTAITYKILLQDRIVSSTGTYSSTGTTSVSWTGLMHIAAFKGE